MTGKKPLSTNKKISLCIISIAIVIPLCIVVTSCALIDYLAAKPMDSYYYETTDIKNYGSYIGNNDNGFALSFVSSFFPEKIVGSFTDITYSYRAENFDIYGFEVYLEFTIKDEAEFNRYIASVAGVDEWQPFEFDQSYMEYSIANVLELSTHGYDGSAYEHPHIIEAEIGKVLYSSAEQKIIYIAIGVYDGGGVTTEYLCMFFERFHINPLVYIDKYEQNAETN